MFFTYVIRYKTSMCTQECRMSKNANFLELQKSVFLSKLIIDIIVNLIANHILSHFENRHFARTMTICYFYILLT